jgi:hypothetical protein
MVDGLGFYDTGQCKVGKAGALTVIGAQVPAKAGIRQSKGAQGLA